MKKTRMIGCPLSKSVFLSLLIAASLETLPSLVVAFSPAKPTGQVVGRPVVSSASTRATVLFGKVKRGKLLSNINIEDAVTTRKPIVSSRSKGKPKKGKGASRKSEEKISPLLAQWAARSSEAAMAEEPSDYVANDSINVTSTFESFESMNSKSKKNQKKSSFRQSAQTVCDETSSVLVSQFLEVLNSELKQKDINDILNPIKELVNLSAPTEQGRNILLGSKNRNDYNLAWVGSNDALCHLGTGLHKAPLARMQEVFLSFPGRNRVELLEVIRVLGPFPNVKNTLQGTVSMGKSSSSSDSLEVADWTLTWDSMIDGTGKELLAGKEENIQKVLLHIFFCTEQVVVAVVPPNLKDPSERRKDIFEDSGKHVLVFIKEEDLDLKLDKYRVS